MKFFIDSCDIENISYWNDLGVGEGITTNPIIIKREGISDVEEHLKKIVAIAKEKPVSIQITETETTKIIAQAKYFSSFGKNVVIKIPVVNAEGLSQLSLIHDLSKQGYNINATVCLMATQAILAAKSGARYVSLFFGRISDQGGDPIQIIKTVRNWLDHTQLNTEIIVGSIRTVYAVNQILMSNPHICTLTPEILNKCSYHAMSKQTASDFIKASDCVKIVMNKVIHEN